MKRAKVLRPDLWPETDQVEWSAAFSVGDPFDDQGPAAHWRPRSRQSVASGYGRWIGWLRDNDPQGPRTSAGGPSYRSENAPVHHRPRAPS